MASLFLRQPLPTVVYADLGQQISLSQVLTTSFGDLAGTFQDNWITYYGADQLRAWNFSYWDLAHQTPTSWKINGVDIGSGLDHQTYVSAANIGSVSISAGTNIYPQLYLDVRTGNDPTNPTYDEYSIQVVASRFRADQVQGRAITAADVVHTANDFAAVYSGTPNPNDCHDIAEAIAGATGATFPIDSFSTNPAENVEGGFWRIAFRGSDAPTNDWYSLTHPGDIVRVDWIDGLFHTFTVMGNENADGSLPVFDNGAGVISIKPSAKYESNVYPESVTIYRLTTDNHYLINGSDLGETIVGTNSNDEIRPGAGNDTIDGGVGVDIAVYTGLRSQYQLTALPNGSLKVTDSRSGSPDGTDTLSRVELLQFADRTVASNDLTTSRAERFFDSATGDHFYTLSPAEANQIRATLPTYHDEGAPWGTPDKGTNTIDVFRFFDVATGAHFLTTSTAERDQVVATLPSYHFEGIAFEAYNAPGDGTLTLERFFNTQSHLHHYAASPAEIASIQNGGAGPGWVDEGAGFIVHA